MDRPLEVQICEDLLECKDFFQVRPNGGTYPLGLKESLKVWCKLNDPMRKRLSQIPLFVMMVSLKKLKNKEKITIQPKRKKDESA